MTFFNKKRTPNQFGWRPSKPDARDLHFTPRLTKLDLPVKVDLTPLMPPVYDQGDLGSCTANSIGAAYEYDEIKQGKKDRYTPSRLFIYYNERMIEGTINSDAGAELRDGIKVVAKYGTCGEWRWPYNPAKFAKKPPTSCYTVGKSHTALQYHAVDNTSLIAMKNALNDGFPIIGGFTVYDSFMSEQVAKDGNVPMPNFSKEKVQGGHAILVVGYNDAMQRFIVRNSWGASWGQAGYFTIPYEYFTNPNLATDFWVIQVIR